eukprot:GEMP01007163.1.p2 GENE.GEMP01007163.1~~GEMP01007163.1.p2  ORF type:complete len:146 (+),score=36.63 GEMP01007163.1:91-528(+)
MTSVLFVCLGNVNRSAVAAALLKDAAPSVRVDSAGTGGHFAGDGAHPYMLKAAKLKGIDLSSHRARQVVSADRDRFDRIIAMDRENFDDLVALGFTPVLFLPTYAPHLNMQDTPDPYYGGGHDKVIDIIKVGVATLARELLEKQM